jgi:hypothetical protein
MTLRWSDGTDSLYDLEVIKACTHGACGMVVCAANDHHVPDVCFLRHSRARSLQ